MKRFASRKLGTAIVLATLASGCALAPPPTGDEVREQALPNARIPAQWTAGTLEAGEVTDGWLLLFHDPALEAIVAEALAYNPDLRIAAARVEAAEAAARAAGAVLYPQLNLAGRGGGKMSGDSSGVQAFGLFASWELDLWELDLWGRVRSEKAAAAAQYDAASLDVRYARASIAALVAKSWFLARVAAAQRAIASEMVVSAQTLSDYSRRESRQHRRARGRPGGRQRPRLSRPGAAGRHRAPERVARDRAPRRSLSIGATRAGKQPAAAAGCDPRGPAVAAARAPSGRTRRGAARGRGVPPHAGGEGRAPSTHLAHRQREQRFQRALRDEGS
jgi:hypothetical protein